MTVSQTLPPSSIVIAGFAHQDSRKYYPKKGTLYLQVMLLLVFCAAFTLGAKICQCFYVTFWMNTSLLFTSSLKWLAITYMFEEKSVMLGYIIFLSAWSCTLGCLSLCLSVSFFLPLCKMSSVSTYAHISSHRRRDRSLKSRHAFPDWTFMFKSPRQ